MPDAPTVLILKPLRPAALDLLRARGLDLRLVDTPTPETVREGLRGVHAVSIKNTPLPAETLDMAPDLRVVAKHGVGLDNLPLDALTARGVPVAHTGDANSAAVAEHAMMLMLAVTRRLPFYDARARTGGFVTDPAHPIRSLAGLRLLLIGTGRIGARVAALARAFGMEVAAHDPAGAVPPGATPAPNLRAALGEADAVSLHCPLTEATRGMVDAAFLAAMRPGSVLVNTARGEVVDEAALLAALERGHLTGAGLDTLAVEPPDPAAPILRSDKVIVTPHVAALTEAAAEAMSMRTARNVLAGLDGTLDPAMVANPEVLR